MKNNLKSLNAYSYIEIKPALFYWRKLTKTLLCLKAQCQVNALVSHHQLANTKLVCNMYLYFFGSPSHSLIAEGSDMKTLSLLKRN